MTARSAVSFCLLALACGCARGTRDAGAAGGTFETVVSDLDSPVWLTAPRGDPRLFVVEQPGRIRIVKDGHLQRTPFLDLTDRVRDGGERGLLSVAFHPDYAHNGYLYVDYTDHNGDTVIERYHVSTDPDRADPGSAKRLLFIDQPYPNHNGGLVTFGPDGFLWIGMGDGGSANDPHDNGQNPRTLLGKLLRIDVDHGDPYAIPRDNPYADGHTGRAEIWSIGMRNPWRFSFDGNLLYVGDVGQDRWEEVDVVSTRTPGRNFGWRRMEANHKFIPTGGEPDDLVIPVIEYHHREGCSVTGGFVYRGRRRPDLVGRYVYGDYCQGWVRSVRADTSGARDSQTLVHGLGPITSFGEDGAGELYVLLQDGRVMRFARR